MPLAQSSPGRQIDRRALASEQEEDQFDGADDSDGDAVSTIHTAERTSFHPARKLSLPLPTKFQRADSGYSGKSSLGALLASSAKSEPLTPELAAMFARFAASNGDNTREPSPTESTGSPGEGAFAGPTTLQAGSTNVRPTPLGPSSPQRDPKSHRPRVASASRRVSHRSRCYIIPLFD